MKKADDADWVWLKVDVKNVFNTLRHEAFIHAVDNLFPECAPSVRWCYEQSSYLQLVGQNPLQSSCGVQQGDPFGPILFSLAIQPIIKQLDLTPGIQFNRWYLNDGIIGGTVQSIAKGTLGQMLPSGFVQRCRQALESVDFRIIQSPGIIKFDQKRKNQLLVKFKCDDVFPRQEVADMIFLADMDIVDATIERRGLIEAGDDSTYITGPELRIFDNIWCVGNACNLYDGSVTTGSVAATNISFDNIANYRQQIPWLDIGKDMSIDSVGRVHSSLDVDSVLFHFQDCSKYEINRDERVPENGYQAILIYYVNDKVAGIVLWGIVRKIRMARQIISEQRHKSEI
ncbi:hypothetical protein GJ496_008629 [Pomphorhynchus laevis]|nr:hypothetical protein GJ496_008629 [Pomphorhynchus laevis]